MVALQTIILLFELSLRQIFALEEDVPPNIAADTILGNMKDKT